MSVAVVEEAARRCYDLSSLESVFSAAAAAPVSLWKRIDEVMHPKVIFTGYGQTEVSAATTLTLPGDPATIVSETVGRESWGPSRALGDGRRAGPLSNRRSPRRFRLPLGQRR
jgi:fatty-acyl-CoA synthase